MFPVYYVNCLMKITSPKKVTNCSISLLIRTRVERSCARTTAFVSQVLQTKDIAVFVQRNTRGIIVKRVSLLSSKSPNSKESRNTV